MIKETNAQWMVLCNTPTLLQVKSFLSLYEYILKTEKRKEIQENISNPG